ncbi:MAG: transcriptional activator HlyU [Alphaproteobacteria bacterium]|nr:MAG: transcriptional activator HlyU [Alphaproteobacteria bacterium]
MGFFSKLFGRSDDDSAESDNKDGATEYHGYMIRPAPRKQGAQWLLAGVITKQSADGVKEHAFVRADTFAARDEAAAFAITKGKQIIDEQGDNIFES